MDYKLVVLGDGGVGKTALTIQLTSNHFVEYYDPTIESCYRRQVVIDEDACILDVLDTAGQEEYTALTSQWIRSGEGFAIVYSIASRSSFERTDKIKETILHHFDTDSVPMILVGNKADLESDREVSTMEGMELAKSWGGVPFLEASAKTRKNVDETFFSLVRQIRKTVPKDNAKLNTKQKLKEKLHGKGCTLI